MTGPLDDHAARAKLVDLVASLRADADQAADAGVTDYAAGLNTAARRVAAVLRRWDIRPSQAA